MKITALAHVCLRGADLDVDMEFHQYTSESSQALGWDVDVSWWGAKAGSAYGHRGACR